MTAQQTLDEHACDDLCRHPLNDEESVEFARHFDHVAYASIIDRPAGCHLVRERVLWHLAAETRRAMGMEPPL